MPGEATISGEQANGTNRADVSRSNDVHASETTEENDPNKRGEPRSQNWEELVHDAPWQARHFALRASLVLPSEPASCCRAAVLGHLCTFEPA